MSLAGLRNDFDLSDATVQLAPEVIAGCSGRARDQKESRQSRASTPDFVSRQSSQRHPHQHAKCCPHSPTNRALDLFHADQLDYRSWHHAVTLRKALRGCRHIQHDGFVPNRSNFTTHDQMIRERNGHLVSNDNVGLFASLKFQGFSGSLDFGTSAAGLLPSVRQAFSCSQHVTNRLWYGKTSVRENRRKNLVAGGRLELPTYGL